jgi:hypothetical protein
VIHLRDGLNAQESRQRRNRKLAFTPDQLSGLLTDRKSITWKTPSSSKADRHLEELMDRKNEGLLDESEREELEALVELSEQLSLVRGEALQILGQRP